MYIQEQLMKARHDGWQRAAARNRRAAALRQARAERFRRTTPPPARRLASLRPRLRHLLP